MTVMGEGAGSNRTRQTHRALRQSVLADGSANRADPLDEDGYIGRRSSRTVFGVDAIGADGFEADAVSERAEYVLGAAADGGGAGCQ